MEAARRVEAAPRVVYKWIGIPFCNMVFEITRRFLPNFGDLLAAERTTIDARV